MGTDAALPQEPRTRAELDPEAWAGDGADLTPVEAGLHAHDREVARWLDAYRADVLIPLRHGDVQVGAVVARGPAPDVTLDEATRDHLGRVAARAAVALTNACHTEDLDRRASTLEQVALERTSALASALEDLKARQAALVQAERQSSLALLVAGVSHEINNALNVISGNVPTLERYARTYEELLERCHAVGAVVPAEGQPRLAAARTGVTGAVAAVGAAARRARAIVEDLRRFARPDETARTRVDLREGLDSTLSLLASLLGERIRVERKGGEAAWVDGFPAALNHVFLNVLLNAAQAITEAGGEGTIEIVVGGDDEVVEVAICDSGPGVAEADRERVFEPFYSTRGATGLGLTVSRQIVERHGGTIVMAGTTARIRLPRARDPAGDAS